MKGEYVPIEKRDNDKDKRDFDKNLEKKRRDKRARSKNQEEMMECTFRPKMSRKAQEQNRSVEDLFQWQRDRKKKLNSQRMRGVTEQEEYTFTPKITQKSSRIASKANTLKDKKTEDRLLTYAKEKHERLDNKRRNQNKGLFKPEFNQRSKEIIKRKNSKDNIETLKKVSNGQVGNVEYFTATKIKKKDDRSSKTERGNRTQRDKRALRNKSNKKFKGKIGTRSLETSKERTRKRRIKPRKKGKRDPL